MQKGSSIPIDVGYYKLRDGEPLEDGVEYQRLIGMLLYLSTNTRPDIAATISILSQKVSCPNKKDWVEVIHLVRYLKNT